MSWDVITTMLGAFKSLWIEYVNKKDTYLQIKKNYSSSQPVKSSSVPDEDLTIVETLLTSIFWSIESNMFSH